MTRSVLRYACCLLGLLAGCRSKPAPPPSVADLHFPVVVLYGKYNVVSFPDPESLGTTTIGNLNAVTEPPPLIDSAFNIYIQQELGSTHNWLWLMINPVGSTPVKFRLERAPKSGLELTREYFLARLDQQTWHDDLPKRRAALARETTLSGMIAVLKRE